MDINKLLDELKAERRIIEEAIITLERIVTGHGKRRGRRPKWMTATDGDAAPKRRGRPPGSKNKPKPVD